MQNLIALALCGCLLTGCNYDHAEGGILAEPTAAVEEFSMYKRPMLPKINAEEAGKITVNGTDIVLLQDSIKDIRKNATVAFQESTEAGFYIMTIKGKEVGHVFAQSETAPIEMIQLIPAEEPMEVFYSGTDLNDMTAFSEQPVLYHNRKGVSHSYGLEYISKDGSVFDMDTEYDGKNLTYIHFYAQKLV